MLEVLFAVLLIVPSGMRMHGASAYPAGALLVGVEPHHNLLAIDSEPAPVIRGWTLTSTEMRPSRHANQGVTTVSSAVGRKVVTRGDGDIAPSLRQSGWTHVGDPDAYDAYIIDAYQGRNVSPAAKLFVITTPAGRQVQFVHLLGPGELFNNSFAAVSPDGHWLVSGEWGVVLRLLVFAMPMLSSAIKSANLPLHSTIVLSHPMRNVQGCAFSTETTLICSTNDPAHDLYPLSRQIISLTLDRALDGRSIVGKPDVLGSVSGTGSCPGDAETEGIDVGGGRLRLAVVQPRSCRAMTRLFTYRSAPSPTRVGTA
ncbi:MAG: hypothetical protein JWM76_1835 [Pseudonocardiales bacterium]|nr:hypothetical protein [Pseudonocardiales bacterium]